MEFQVLSWLGKDNEEEENYRIAIFGRTADGKSVCVKTTYNPFFYIQIPKAWKQSDIDIFVSSLSKKMGSAIIRSTKKVKKKKFYGFTNLEIFSFLKLSFDTKQAMTRCVYIFKNGRMKINNKMCTLYESNIEPWMKFCHQKDIETAGWISFNNGSLCKVQDFRVEYEFDVKSADIYPVAIPRIAPFIQASFDIEVYSHDGSFPDPKVDECVIFQIATTFQRYGEPEPFKRHLISLKSCDDIEDVELECYETEQEVLNAWAELVHRENPDILIGYNIWQFDLDYMYIRANKMKAEKFMFIGREIHQPIESKTSSFSSSAYGDSDFKMLTIDGRLQIDLLVIIKREHKLTKYTLDFVSEHFLKDKKVDITPKQMFALFRGDSADRQKVGIYCVKDTDLPLKLVNKLAIIPNMVEMAKATWVPLSFLIERGQGIKVFSQLLYATKHEDMLIKVFDKSGFEAKYEGATVLAPIKGAYIDTPITGLDFASLYPTIMMAHKLCPSNWVNDEKYNEMDEIEYTKIDEHIFAQTHEGVVPKLLRNLATNRKLAKKDMKKAKDDGDEFMYQVYNGKQLAFKVSMNSIYGFMGANLGQVPCKPVAQCTTSIGRQMIDQTKNLVEEWYPGSEVVYGDSVAANTPILLRINKRITIKEIQDICNFGDIDVVEKQYGVPYKEMCVWTESGWTKIERVMRHKLEESKKMMTVCTPTGIVDVTSDHSLLDFYGKEVKPTELNIGDRLMHSFPFVTPEHSVVNGRIARMWGFFMGCGKCGIFGTPQDCYMKWELTNTNAYKLIFYKELLEDLKYEVTIEKEGSLHSLSVKYPSVLIKQYVEFLYHYNLKKVPDMILNSDVPICEQFIIGLIDSSDNVGFIEQEGKVGCLGIYVILRKMKYNVRIEALPNNKFKLYFGGNQEYSDFQIQSILECENKSKYVYDLTTSNSHFHAGVGQLIVHNTDSVMVKFNTQKTGHAALVESFRLGEEAADRISATFKKPIELEFEKVYWPYLLWAKKRYSGLMYTNVNKWDYIDSKGIQIVRRDVCKYVRDTMSEILNKIMYEKDVTLAIEIAKKATSDLLCGNYDLDDLIVSKSLKRIAYKYEKETKKLKLIHEYKNPQPHVVVAGKMESREPGTGPRSGDRVPYVFIETTNKKELQCNKAEDPVYAKTEKLAIDTKYYIENALMSPIESIFELFIENPKEEIFENIKRNYHQSKQMDIYSFLAINLNK